MKILPRENASRVVHAVCPYWLTSKDGLSARTGGDPSSKLGVLLVKGAKPAFIHKPCTQFTRHTARSNSRKET